MWMFLMDVFSCIDCYYTVRVRVTIFALNADDTKVLGSTGMVCKGRPAQATGQLDLLLYSITVIQLSTVNDRCLYIL